MKGIRHTAQRVKRYGHTVNIRLTDNTIIITSCTINNLYNYKSVQASAHDSPLSLTHSLPAPLSPKTSVQAPIRLKFVTIYRV